MAGGEYCAIWLGPELPGDQRDDDAKSACFDGAAARRAARHRRRAGHPAAARRPTGRSAMVAVRLCDVQPDGASTRITYGVLNLCHRDGHEFPEAVVPGEAMEIALKLDDIAYQVPPGHRLRVAVSSTYWPLVWPSPRAGDADAARRRHRPADPRLRRSGDECVVRGAGRRAPWRIETLRKSANSRIVERDPATGAVTLAIVDDFGEVRDLDHGLVTAASPASAGRIDPADPLSARGETHWTADPVARRTGRCAPKPSRR